MDVQWRDIGTRLVLLTLTSCFFSVAVPGSSPAAPAARVALVKPRVTGWPTDPLRAEVGATVRARLTVQPATTSPLRARLQLRSRSSSTWRTAWSATTSRRGTVVVRVPTSRSFDGWARVSFAGGGTRATSTARRFVVIEPTTEIPEPEPEPETTTADELEREVLRLVNVARSQTRWCGPTEMVATTALAGQPQLGAAARAYATRMGTESFFSHYDAAGGGPVDRAKAAGYTGSFIGENIAAGYGSPQDVVTAWLRSPGHCQNLMSPHAEELGVGFARVSGSSMTTYWVQMFGVATQ